MPGGSRYGQPVPADLAPYVGTGKGTPIAGARAAGGPVGSGKSYLVGEHGPEVFTPGLSGAISTHAATRLALARGAAGGDGSGGEGTGREIRFLSFALVSAVDDVARSIDRLGARAGLPSDAGISGGGGFGTGGGSGLGGRRGFGARMGGSGDGVALPDGSTGPRVGLGRMGSGGGRRGFAKFDAKAPAIMGALMSKYGLTKEQAARPSSATWGHESGGFTAYHGGRPSAGPWWRWMGQWTGPRRRAFERWTAQHGLNPTSDDASWRFLTEGRPRNGRRLSRRSSERIPRTRRWWLSESRFETCRRESLRVSRQVRGPRHGNGTGRWGRGAGLDRQAGC